MRKREMRERLSHQTDLILLEENLGEGSIVSFDSHDDQLESLLELATALKETLVPLTNPSLKSRVRETLANYSTPDVLLRGARRVPAFWIVLALAGSIISIIGVIVLLFRRLKIAGKSHLRRRLS